MSLQTQTRGFSNQTMQTQTWKSVNGTQRKREASLVQMSRRILTRCKPKLRRMPQKCTTHSKVASVRTIARRWVTTCRICRRPSNSRMWVETEWGASNCQEMRSRWTRSFHARPTRRNATPWRTWQTTTRKRSRWARVPTWCSVTSASALKADSTPTW